MKTQIDIDTDLWNRFKEKVTAEGKTLREMVPYVFEPAIMTYLNPPPTTTTHVESKPDVALKRCESCDTPTERRFSSNGKKVCYACWKGELTADTAKSVEPTPPPE